MSVETDLDAWWAVKTDYDESNSAKGKVQEMYNAVVGMVADLGAMNAAGDFDELPTSAKDAAIFIWQKYNAANNAVDADADAVSFLGWTP